jgi:excisionase family DNA binding protein
MSERTFTIQVPADFMDALADAMVARAGDARADDDGYLNTESAARYLDAPVSRVHDLVQRGVLVPHKDGRRLLFTRAQLRAHVEGRG